MLRGSLTEAVLARVCARGTAVLVGPAGIGKTTLARRVIGDRPSAVGQSLPSLSDRELQPLVHALRTPLEGDPDEVAVAVAARLGDRWLVIEDLHWADPGTRAVLARLVGRVPMLTTTRDGDPFGEDVLRSTLPPLSPRSARSLLRRHRPELDAAARDHLLGVAGGNPLLLLELPGPESTGEVHHSPTLAGAVQARVAALPEQDREALWLLALHGRPAPPELLDATSAGPGGLAVTDDDGRSWFTHDLVREAVEASVPPDRRVELHTALAARSGPADAAAHLLAAGDPGRAAAAAEEAAVGADVPERARLLLLAVGARADGAPDALRLRAAEALLAANRAEEADRVAAGVRTGDAEGRATAGWLRARAAWMRGEFALAREVSADALAWVAGSGTPAEAHLRVERATFEIRDRPGDPTLVEEIALALDVAERAGVDRARAHSLRGRSLAHSFRPGWRDHYRAARRIAGEDGDADQECAAAYWELSAAGFFGPLSDALAVGGELVRRANELGQVTWHHLAVATHGLHAAVAGVLDPDLVPELERILRHDPEFRNRAQVRAALALAHVDQGDLSGAAAVIDTGREQARTPDDRALMAVAAADLADATGDTAAMHGALDELVACGVGFFGMKVMAEGSAVHLFLSGPEQPDLPRFSAACPPIVGGIVEERAAYDAAVAGDRTAAASHLRDRAARWASMGAPRLAARALHGAGTVAAGAGDRAAATRLFDDALALSERHGFGPIASAARRGVEDLRATALRSRLTGRELAVMDLVATGATSAQIADRLGIGRTTVDSHVDSARRKLGAATRRHAAALVTAGAEVAR